MNQVEQQTPSTSVPAWFDWKEPDYDRVFAMRTARIKHIRATPGMWEGLKAHYKDNPVDFINDWGMTVDPRNAEIDLPTTIPFLMFPKQEDFVHWLLGRWRGREDGLTEKSRDAGLSWLCVAFGVWMWLFYDGVSVGFGSRKEDYVDKLGDPKALFWKVRQFIALLPEELRPAGYNEKRDALFMRIINCENGSTIVGEAGDNIGRGNRTSIYFKDESAFYERPELIDAALSQTSNCKIDVSTPNGNGNPFYRKRHGGKIPVFTFHWKNDPRKDDEWYQKQKDTLDPVILAQEVDIDYNASVNDAWITGDLVDNMFNTGLEKLINHSGQWRIGIDAAHMGDDETILHFRKNRLNLPQIGMRKKKGPQIGGRVEDECKTLEALGDQIECITVELDGPGTSTYDFMTREDGPYKDKIVGIHTGARLSDDVNYNVRALLHRRAKEYLEAPPVTMKEDVEFKAQISSIKFRYKNGLLLMQDKKEYKSEFGRSPDKSDGFILTFADNTVKKSVFTGPQIRSNMPKS